MKERIKTSLFPSFPFLFLPSLVGDEFYLGSITMNARALILGYQKLGLTPEFQVGGPPDFENKNHPTQHIL